MTVLRSPRLEALLGRNLIDQGVLEYAHLQLLVDGQIPEAEDLDYKRDLYGNSEAEKRKLSTDVAALASTRGGLLVLGIDEDDQGRAKEIIDVALSDAESTRMHQVIAAGTAPQPTFEIIPVENPARPGFGCYVVAVAAGPRQPYTVPVNDGYRYPRRIGTTIGYLTEPEIETAYRRRDTARRDQATRAQQITEDLVRHLPSQIPWLLLSLVPDHPGEAPINAVAFAKVRPSYQGSHPWLIGSLASWGWRNFGLGQRRYVLDDQWNPEQPHPKRIAAHLHDDGAGVFAVTPVNHPDNVNDVHDFDDELIVMGILSGIRFLSEHAALRANVAGVVSLQMSITDVRPACQIVANREGWGPERLGRLAKTAEFRPAEAPRARWISSPQTGRIW
ncbi:ATP-binding protein [Nonomuraea dietziae]|uniref:AlbA family DNA-binding domain-containing protein n=1 Tax=Nonomuraea dietziae TaxID=65515 RepID=UPI0031D2CF15